MRRGLKHGRKSCGRKRGEQRRKGRKEATGKRPENVKKEKCLCGFLSLNPP